MPSEPELFNLNGVLITSRRFTVRQHSFSLQSITACTLADHPRWWLTPAATTTLTVLLASFAIRTASGLAASVAVLSMLLAAWLWISKSRRYCLEIDTEDGHFTPLRSRDRFFAAGVASTLQAAVRLREFKETATEVAPEAAPSAHAAPFAIPVGTRLMPILCAPTASQRAAALPVLPLHKLPAADFETVSRKNSIA